MTSARHGVPTGGAERGKSAIRYLGVSVRIRDPERPD